MNTFRFGFGYYKKIMPVAIICQLMGFVAIFVGTFTPLIAQMIIDCVLNYNPNVAVKINPMFNFLVSGKYGAMGTWDLFFSIAIFLMLVILLRVFLIYVRNNIFMRNGLRMENALKHDTYKKLLSIDLASIAHYKTGNLLNILNQDIINFKEAFVFNWLCILDAIFMLVCISIWLGEINLLLLIIPLALFPILLVVLNRYLKRAKEISTKIRDKSADLNQIVEEGVNGVRLVKAYTNEGYEYNKFQDENLVMRKYYDEQVLIQSKYNLIFNVIRQCAYVASITLAAYLVITGGLTVGYLLTCTSYVTSIMAIITNFNNCCYSVQQQMVSGEKIKNFLAEKDMPEQAETDVIDNFDIEVKNATLDIDGVKILNDVTISIPYGSSLGIMGETGSGKTVLLKTLSRIMPLTSGTITIGDKDIVNIPIETLRSQFSYVFQDVFLFSNTIDANIAFSRPESSEDEVADAAKSAKAHSFITNMPESYSTIVGEKGLGLSGGQKQRISIARALIKNAPILVLDDATSALDRTTESDLLATIKEKYPHKTLIISSHKVSACKDCDTIIYMRKGRILEMGSYDELIAKNGAFAKVCKEQSEEASE